MNPVKKNHIIFRLGMGNSLWLSSSFWKKVFVINWLNLSVCSLTKHCHASAASLPNHPLFMAVFTLSG